MSITSATLALVKILGEVSALRNGRIGQRVEVRNAHLIDVANGANNVGEFGISQVAVFRTELAEHMDRETRRRPRLGDNQGRRNKMTTHITLGTYGAKVVSNVRAAASPYIAGVVFCETGASLADLTWHDLDTLGAWGECIGTTTQGDRVYVLAADADTLIAADAAKRAIRLQKEQAEYDAEAAYAKAQAAVVSGSKIFPGLRGYEEGEV